MNFYEGAYYAYMHISLLEYLARPSRDALP